jgi:hypothetical protein
MEIPVEGYVLKSDSTGIIIKAKTKAGFFMVYSHFSNYFHRQYIPEGQPEERNGRSNL